MKTDKQGVLTKEDILDYIKNDGLSFTPKLDKFQMQSHAIDLRLGFTFMIPKNWKLTTEGRQAIDTTYSTNMSNFDVIELEHGQFFDILPNEFVIFTTLEAISLPDDLMAILYPRSSVNRRGLSVDLSGIIDAGYSGQLIVPVRNNTNTQTIRVYPGERFCQLTLQKLSSKATIKQSRFHNKDVAFTVGTQKEIDETELDLVKLGKLKELKEQYSIE